MNNDTQYPLQPKKIKTVQAAANKKSNNTAAVTDNRSTAAKQQKQLKAMAGTGSTRVPIQQKENNAGLPEQLKSGIENISGMAMDDVKVQYNSPKPAQLNAHAYAQGTAIHIAPGQEKHLPHEAWHVVQQKQGRVQATAQLKGGTPVNDDKTLEKEADIMGAKAMQATATGHVQQFNSKSFLPAVQQADKLPVQRKKSHATTFIKENKLGIESDHDSVKAYVDNTGNPALMRKGLLKAWNRHQVHLYRIATPVDLQATSTSYEQVEDLHDWNSDEEDALDLGKTIHKRKKDDVDLERSGKIPDKTGVPEVSLFDAIRFGRQVNKREDYDRLPLTTDVGGHKIEYDNPGTKDIYATPLDEIISKEKPGKKPARRRFRRAGQSKEFNWKTLGSNLDSAKYTNPRKHQTNMLKFFLRKGKLKKMDSHTAEALAAIGSDLMKGSSGGRFYLREALKLIKKSKKQQSFSSLFSGDSPLYKPAAEKGRALVSSKHREIQFDANRLLGVNNCLINAIALAAGLPMPNLGQLMRIRERLGNYGEMLLATDEVVALIKEVLNINTAIAVIYQDRASEDFDGVGGPLLIYHVNGNHFTHVMPHNFVVYAPKSKPYKKQKKDK